LIWVVLLVGIRLILAVLEKVLSLVKF